MSEVKIFYKRKASPRGTQKNTIVFDSIMGLGINTNWPYDFRFKYGDKIYGNDIKALAKMNEPLWDGKTFFEIMPILPTIPAQWILITNWYSFPSVTPEVRELPYRCHFLRGGAESLTWLPWDGSPEVAAVWDALGVYEFSTTMMDGEDKIENPDYLPAVEAYNQKIQEAKAFIREHFVLMLNVLSPTKLPTEATNESLKPTIRSILGLSESDPIPEEYFWHWWFVKDDGTLEPTVVSEKEYILPPVPVNDEDHPQWDLMALNSVLQSNTLKRAKQILGIR